MVLTIFTMNTGCATIMHGSSATIHIESEEPGAKIYVDDEFVGTRDVAIEVSKKRSPVISVRKAGCDEGTAVVEKKFDAATLWGLLWDFGLISILIVDFAATGAVNKFERTNFTVNPHCDNTRVPTAVASPAVTGSSICAKAFDHIEDLANAWIEWHPAADPQDALPKREAFMAVCEELPEEVQLCLTLKYNKGHHEQCTENLDGLPARTKARLNRLFVRPQTQQ
jgi:hypothetical protein